MKRVQIKINLPYRKFIESIIKELNFDPYRAYIREFGEWKRKTEMFEDEILSVIKKEVLDFMETLDSERYIGDSIYSVYKLKANDLNQVVYYNIREIERVEEGVLFSRVICGVIAYQLEIEVNLI
jgi:hypothetical protein